MPAPAPTTRMHGYVLNAVMDDYEEAGHILFDVAREYPSPPQLAEVLQALMDLIETGHVEAFLLTSTEAQPIRFEPADLLKSGCYFYRTESGSALLDSFPDDWFCNR